MNKHVTGVIFICVAALLLMCRYVVAAIVVIGTEWAVPIFREALYETSALLIASVISGAAGIFYIVWGERTKENRR